MPVSASASDRDSSPKELSPREVDSRRDAAVRRALSTPPKPQDKKPLSKTKKKQRAESY